MKKWKENRGSITLFVLIAILFFVAILMGIYVSNTNKQRTSQSLNKQILDSYENNVNKVDEIYQGLVPSVPAYPDELEYKEGTIDEGLVVIDSNNNEYVWIPVENPVAETEAEITSMVAAGKYPIAVKTSGTDANGRPNYRGVLYDFGYDSNNNKVSITPMPYSPTSGNREPAFSTAVDGITQDSVQKEFNLMVEKVNANKGFYVGRYESSYGVIPLELKIQPNIFVWHTNFPFLTPDTTADWTSIYHVQNGTIGAAKTHTIWGSQYDQIMIFMKDVQKTVQKVAPLAFVDEEPADYPSYPFYIIDSTNMGNYSGSILHAGTNDSYKVKNVYDLAGNVWELTMEEDENGYRAIRGGDYNGNSNNSTLFGSKCVASKRYQTIYKAALVGTRITLY